MIGNMKIEDRLADKLKSEEFGSWFGEEDLHDLIKRAIDVAFFQTRLDPNGGYGSPDLPPVIVEHARKHIDTIVSEVVEKLIREKFAADPAGLDAVLAPMLEKTIGDLALKSLMRTFSSAFQMTQFDLQNRIVNALRGQP